MVSKEIAENMMSKYPNLNVIYWFMNSIDFNDISVYKLS